MITCRPMSVRPSVRGPWASCFQFVTESFLYLCIFTKSIMRIDKIYVTVHILRFPTENGGGGRTTVRGFDRLNAPTFPGCDFVPNLFCAPKLFCAKTAGLLRFHILIFHCPGVVWERAGLLLCGCLRRAAYLAGL